MVTRASEEGQRRAKGGMRGRRILLGVCQGKKGIEAAATVPPPPPTPTDRHHVRRRGRRRIRGLREKVNGAFFFRRGHFYHRVRHPGLLPPCSQTFPPYRLCFFVSCSIIPLCILLHNLLKEVARKKVATITFIEELTTTTIC